MCRWSPYAEAMSGLAAPERSIAELERAIADAIGSIGPMVIAFSGGVDSALVVAAASRFLESGQVLADFTFLTRINVFGPSVIVIAPHH